MDIFKEYKMYSFQKIQLLSDVLKIKPLKVLVILKQEKLTTNLSFNKIIYLLDKYRFIEKEIIKYKNENGKYSKRIKELKIKKWKKGYKQNQVDKFFKDLYLQALKRDGYKCVICSSTKGLGIHHINFIHEDMYIENLETLCWYHHKEKHKRRTQCTG